MTELAQEAALADLVLTDLWGVAKRLALRLNALGIEKPLQLRDADPSLLRERIGVVMERMALELRGTPCQALTLAVPANKSILSRSFGRAVTERHELRTSTHVARAAVRRRNRRRRLGVRDDNPSAPGSAIPGITLDRFASGFSRHDRARKSSTDRSWPAVAAGFSLQEGRDHAAGAEPGWPGAGRSLVSARYATRSALLIPMPATS
jgi:hypothetical protein